MMNKIAQAIVKAQKEFAPALKDTNNPFFKSKYADLSSCINSVIDALNNHGIALIQKNHDCADGVKVETILLHESGEEYSGGILHVPTAKNDPQGYGSALTYARRYSLMATCGIAPEDDDGNAAKQPIKPSPAPKFEPPQELVNTHLIAIENAKSLEDLHAAYESAIAKLGVIPVIHNAKNARGKQLKALDNKQDAFMAGLEAEATDPNQ